MSDPAATDWQPHQGFSISADSYEQLAGGHNHGSSARNALPRVAALQLVVARTPVLDHVQHKASVSHANAQRAGVDSRTGLKCTWLDLHFFAPGGCSGGRILRQCI